MKYIGTMKDVNKRTVEYFNFDTMKEFDLYKHKNNWNENSYTIKKLLSKNNYLVLHTI